MEILNSRYLLWLILACPLTWFANGWRAEGLLYGEMIHVSGDLSARLLILTMAITPLRLMFPGARWPMWLLHRRRYFGVAAFAYGMLHTVIYIDRKQSLGLILEEGADFSIWTGWIALAIFIALAATSNDASVRRLKRGWKKLHRWVYPAAILVFVHWIFVAFSFVPGLVHLSVLVFFEAGRVWKKRKIMSHAI
jgi:sulfoxide reductase heme-binding subunit YedZ